jgi:hypothetical protein
MTYVNTTPFTRVGMSVDDKQRLFGEDLEVGHTP